MLVHAMHTAGMNAPVLLDCFVAMTSHVFCVSEFPRERMTKHNHAAFLLSDEQTAAVVPRVCHNCFLYQTMANKPQTLTRFQAKHRSEKVVVRVLLPLPLPCRYFMYRLFTEKLCYVALIFLCERVCFCAVDGYPFYQVSVVVSWGSPRGTLRSFAMTSHVFCVSEFFRERMTKHNHAAFLLSEDLRPPSRVVKVVCMESCPRAVDA